ncbi:MAG: glucosaminidase domain-containing protein [Wenzhouxiangellaceae bacterium]|nr:glucosaminidase domain-containing protein [Wenzhouxiangellaceae bacterium]
MIRNEPRNSPSWLWRLTRILDPVNPAYAAAAIFAVVILLVALVLWWKPAPLLPDFSNIEDVAARKEAFFGYLAPLVESENQRIREQRKRLLELADSVADGQQLGRGERRWLQKLSRQYELDWNADDIDAMLEAFKKRVDVVPVALALVQAATESAWGQSRFAVEGNNLFGQWCYERGCGLVPLRRSAGQAHEVAAFGSVQESVSRYINNLNTHSAYQPLREIRFELRRAGQPPTAMALAEGLVRYSEKRETYVDEVKQVIRLNRPIIEAILE